MSASTVSITAANPAARRRPVVSTERTTTNIEMLANDVGVSPIIANPGAGGDEKVTSSLDVTFSSPPAPGLGNGRDLSHHSIRGDAVLDRSSKDFVQAKKAIGNSTAVQRKTRKVLPKPDKPRWLTVLSIFAKNFVHLDVESLLKTTAKMIQGAILVSELRKLESKSEGHEKSLGDLTAVEWLSKEEFQKIYDELKKSKGGDLGEASLDEIKTYAREIIEKEIQKHAADGLGRVDYALASSGAMVVKHSELFILGRQTNWFFLSAKNGLHTNAYKMLKPSFGEPGQCFALKGSSGLVQIKLRTAIIPESVTLEHVAKFVASSL
ncbi:hypothetical protein K1719_042055 [Acacia pycnantha]|nr:hypothetical protein K1719_042055 [Acacia pycnantha]